MMESIKSGIERTPSTACAEVVLFTTTKKHLISRCSYKFKRTEIMSKSQTLANQEVIGHRPHHAYELFSSEVVRITYFQHDVTIFQRVRL